MTARTWKRIGLVSCCAIGSLLLLAAEPGGDKTEEAIRVTLTKRVDNDAYKTSAYSFRNQSQDVAVHKNEVDLLLNNCGLLHLLRGDEKNRIAHVGAKKLADVQSSPKEGWQTSCVRPEKDDVYVMEIDDGTTRFKVKLRVLEAKGDKLTFEWAPLHEVAAEAGTMGMCGGEHDCR